MEYINFVDSTMTTTSTDGEIDDMSEFDTSDLATGMFDHRVLCNFYWGGMGWIILKVYSMTRICCSIYSNELY